MNIISAKIVTSCSSFSTRQEYRKKSSTIIKLPKTFNLQTDFSHNFWLFTPYISVCVEPHWHCVLLVFGKCFSVSLCCFRKKKFGKKFEEVSSKFWGKMGKDERKSQVCADTEAAAATTAAAACIHVTETGETKKAPRQLLPLMLLLYSILLLPPSSAIA